MEPVELLVREDVILLNEVALRSKFTNEFELLEVITPLDPITKAFVKAVR